MKIVVLILFFLLVFVSIVAIIFMLGSVVSRARRGKSNPRRSSKIGQNAQRQIIPFRMLAEYYGGLKQASDARTQELFRKGLSLKQNGKFSEAIKPLEECLNRNLTPEQKIGLLLTTGNCYFALDKLDLAQEYYGKADHLSRESDNTNGRLSCLINLGLVCAVNQKWDDAITNYHQAIGLDQKLGSAEGEAIDLNTLALLYENKGDLEGALTHYTASLLIFERLSDRGKVELVESNIRRLRNPSARTDT
jgi:tetratricopeptide (TPR) repeat protein